MLGNARIAAIVGAALIAAGVVFVVVSPGSSAANLSIADAEAIGFERTQDKMFQIVQALDGAGGRLDGHTVEIYQYAPGASVPPALEAAAAPGNISGWVAACQVGNLVMLTKGKSACEALATLAD